MGTRRKTLFLFTFSWLRLLFGRVKRTLTREQVMGNVDLVPFFGNLVPTFYPVLLVPFRC